MPRRRTTKDKTKRPGPTIPSGDEGANIGVECRKEKVKTLIEDFENEGCIKIFHWVHYYDCGIHSYVCATAAFILQMFVVIFSTSKLLFLCNVYLFQQKRL